MVVVKYWPGYCLALILLCHSTVVKTVGLKEWRLGKFMPIIKICVLWNEHMPAWQEEKVCLCSVKRSVKWPLFNVKDAFPEDPDALCSPLLPSQQLARVPCPYRGGRHHVHTRVGHARVAVLPVCLLASSVLGSRHSVFHSRTRARMPFTLSGTAL